MFVSCFRLDRFSGRFILLLFTQIVNCLKKKRYVDFSTDCIIIFSLLLFSDNDFIIIINSIIIIVIFTGIKRHYYHYCQLLLLLSLLILLLQLLLMCHFLLLSFCYCCYDDHHYSTEIACSPSNPIRRSMWSLLSLKAISLWSSFLNGHGKNTPVSVYDKNDKVYVVISVQPFFILTFQNIYIFFINVIEKRRCSMAFEY